MKTKVITARVSLARYKQINNYAREFGMSKNEFVNKAIEDEITAAEKAKEEQQLIRAIKLCKNDPEIKKIIKDFDSTNYDGLENEPWEE